MTTLHDQLADLADEAPPGGPVPGLWQQGVRRQRRRQATRLGAVAAAVVVLVALAGFLRPTAPDEPRPVQVPFGQLHLPRTVYPPDRWADGTDETGPPGPLAVVSTTYRNRAVGLRDAQEELRPFGVSAVDGKAVFLDLVGGNGLLSDTSLTLSPDGRKVGYIRYGQGEEVLGFGVYDTVTGETVLLDDPDRPVLQVFSYDLTFSGDSRFLQTSYSLTGSRGSRDHSLVVWDVDTGEPVVAEPAGHYWLPTMGRAPSGIVWSRGRQVHTFDPTTGRRSSFRADVDVFMASWGPDGRAFAAVAPGETDQDDWRLFAGPSSTDLREMELPIVPDHVLGWRDDRHVLVRELPRRGVVEVDVRTGRATPVPLKTSGQEVDLPVYAADLWANPLVDGVRPPDASDPRLPWLVGGAAGLVVSVGALVLGLRWRRRA